MWLLQFQQFLFKFILGMGKRAWNNNLGGMGKRGWNSGFTGMGKRGWNSGFTGMGKRGWNSGFTGMGKRGWNSGFTGWYSLMCVVDVCHECVNFSSPKGIEIAKKQKRDTLLPFRLTIQLLTHPRKLFSKINTRSCKTN